MSAQENKALVRRFVKAQANADLDTLDELLAADFVDHSLQPDQGPGREGFMRSVAEEPAIFSNVRANIEDQAAEGDKLISRLTLSRIHDRGEFLGVAPTGMEIKTSAIVIHRIVGARLSRSGARVRVIWRQRASVWSKRGSSASASSRR